jgi:hypothetical protein
VGMISFAAQSWDTDSACLSKSMAIYMTSFDWVTKPRGNAFYGARITSCMCAQHLDEDFFSRSDPLNSSTSEAISDTPHHFSKITRVFKYSFHPFAKPCGNSSEGL